MTECDPGRAIRHKDDWAAFILVDCRYSTKRVRSKLPHWIEQTSVVAETFGQAVKELATFYKSKR